MVTGKRGSAAPGPAQPGMTMQPIPAASGHEVPGAGTDSLAVDAGSWHS